MERKVNKNNKVIIITGTSSGFGKLTAIQLASEGNTVYAAMRNIGSSNAQNRSDLENWATDNGRNLRVIELDVTDDRSVETAIEYVIAESGRIDVVVNNAGQMFVGISEAYTVEDVRKQFEVNFFGMVRVNRAVLPQMRKQRSGLLVQVSSQSGRLVFPFFGLYSASKFAVEALAESYRYELSSFGIDSVIVQPGPFGTNLLPGSPEPSDRDRILSYGDLAAFPENMKANFNSIYESAEPPVPQDVADAITALINMDTKRPLRTSVMPKGMDFGVGRMNDQISVIQNDLMTAFQMSSMI